MQEIAPGLVRWTAAHPAWRPGAEPGSPADWPEHVGCVAYVRPDVLILIDPLVEDWTPLDALAAGREVVVLTTMRFHGRSRDEVVARYGGSLASHRSPPPAGVERIAIAGMDESMVWIPEHRTLVPGDRLIGDAAGGVSTCPESWLGYLPDRAGAGQLRDALQPLLDLPVEHVLVSHGEPVVRDGREAIRRALDG